ncbi:MAG: KpsF/GutQ family sugar-phosphate isomerase [Prosthecobacter sp.]|jgi:arabinose-5-phosphate isomerase|uniref:KpsF/GutQ family sugar-phosphate isomerase n=1 Tax=Prosthecobacter sp. TaxID=1965333 RepID=UPI0019DA1188|nr:KpsF/GutQ family sugar-phosphate isomerase [Prosthecobacter sp.]MBE2287263.1 KpsF/GutQ family sugar-phosphate isomerase [Prosthecobacter sp.]
MNYPEKARRVIQLEIDELQRLHARIDDSFARAIELMLPCVRNRGKLIVCGVGKSGNIGRKLAATLNSTGATTVLLNVGDALHGDLGVVDPGDLAILLSYSGETSELLDLLPHLKRFDIPIVAITGGLQSTLAKNADVVLDVHVTQEACPLNLAPTSSTTTMLVLCDALAMALLEARGFQSEDFAKLHPGGSLGRALLTRVSDVMRSGDQLAKITPDTHVREALEAMTKARSGAAIVENDDGTLAGVFTHGDFVRAFQKDDAIAAKAVSGFMTPSPISIQADKLAAEVLATLQKYRIDDVVVVDGDGRAVGMIDTQDLTRLRLI